MNELLGLMLSGFFLSTGVAKIDHNNPPPNHAWAYDRPRFKDPYGIIELGDTVPVSKSVSFTLKARHFSSLATRVDHGDNTVELLVTWRPFVVP